MAALSRSLSLQFWHNMGMFAAVSNDTQHVLSVMLEDQSFVDRYVLENNRRLKQSYDLLTATFERAGMRYMPACAAMFCWLDLRQLLEQVRRQPCPVWLCWLSVC